MDKKMKDFIVSKKVSIPVKIDSELITPFIKEKFLFFFLNFFGLIIIIRTFCQGVVEKAAPVSSLPSGLSVQVLIMHDKLDQEPED